MGYVLFDLFYICFIEVEGQVSSLSNVSIQLCQPSD